MNYFKYIISMLIFGTIGIIVKNINLPTTQIVFVRTIIASIMFILIFALSSKKINYKIVKKNLIYLILSGCCVGLNWVFLFESYKYNSVGVATLLYYTAPIIVIILSPFFLNERITFIKVISVFISVVGMYLVSGINISDFKANYGLFISLLGAFFYAMLMICSKKITNLDGLNITFIQMFIACIVMGIYVLFINKERIVVPDNKSIVYLVILGVIHTGFACFLYFDSMNKLPTISVAVLSYIDPISSVFFANIFLMEILTTKQIMGAVMILCSTLFVQIFNRK